MCLIDNMGLVHSLDKGRCKNFGGLVQARRWAAHVLAADVLPVPRWLALELNPPDEPSRRYVGEWRGRRAEASRSDEAGAAARRLEPYGRPPTPAPLRFHGPAILFALAHPPPAAVLPGPRCATSILERIPVGRSTQEDYEKRLMSLRTLTRENGTPLDCNFDAEEALFLYMTEAFLEGRASDFGSKLLAPFQWQKPQYGRHGSRSLPRERLAMQGWAKGAPPQYRLPMAWLEACAIAAEMARAKMWGHEVCLLLMYGLYLRPGEAFSLTVGCAAPPVREGGTSTQHWPFTIRAYEKGVPAKTGSYDDSVVLDHPGRLFLGPLVEAMRHKRKATDPLFATVSARSFNKAFREATQRLRLDLVRKRGRWRSEASRRRYEKKLQAKLAAMPEMLRAQMYHVAPHIEAIM